MTMRSTPGARPDPREPGPALRDVLDHDLRVLLLFLLALYPRLNVSQASKILGMNKTTVSRHLKILEEAGVLDVEEVPARGKINPKYYYIPQERLKEAFPLSKVSLPPSGPERLARYAQIVRMLRAVPAFIKKSLDLIDPILDRLDALIQVGMDEGDVDTIDDAFARWAVKRVDFQTLLFSDKKIHKFYELYDDFRRKAKALAREPDEDIDADKHEPRNTMLFFDMILPLKEIVDDNIERVSRAGRSD